MDINKFIIVLVYTVSIGFMRAQILEKCQDQSYPPDKRIEIPTEIVNLDLPARQRWTDVVQSRRQAIIDFIKYAKSLLPEAIESIVERLLVGGVDKLPLIYKEEIIGIGEALQVPLGEIFAGNIFYELEKLCTSIVTQDEKGRIYHARNMDLGALLGWDRKKQTWKIAELLRKLVVNIEFRSNNKVVYKSVHFAGTVGIFTGVAPGRFSISLNSRSPDHAFGGPMSVFSWLYFSDSNGLKERFPSFWARTVLNEAENYNKAVEMLSSKQLLAPVYFILAGGKPNEGMVITRTKTETLFPRSFENQRGSWYLLQTNYDGWKKAPFYDNRRSPSMLCLSHLYNSVERQGEDHFNILFNVLSTIPVLNKATVYTALMTPDNGELESYKRTCPGQCYPW